MNMLRMFLIFSVLVTSAAQAQIESEPSDSQKVTPKFGRAGASQPQVERPCELKLDINVNGYAEPVLDAVQKKLDQAQDDFSHLRLVMNFTRFNKKKLFEIRIQEQKQKWTMLGGHRVAALVEVFDRTGETHYVRARSSFQATSYRSYQDAVAEIASQALHVFGEDLNFAARELQCNEIK